MYVFVTGDTLPVVNVTQLEKDTVLICYDREFFASFSHVSWIMILSSFVANLMRLECDCEFPAP